MKKRNKKVSLTILATATVMAVPVLFGCGNEAPAAAPAPAEDVTEAPAAEPTEDVTEEPADTPAEDVTEDATEVGMANPWVEMRRLIRSAPGFLRHLRERMFRHGLSATSWAIPRRTSDQWCSLAMNLMVWTSPPELSMERLRMLIYQDFMWIGQSVRRM